MIKGHRIQCPGSALDLMHIFSPNIWRHWGFLHKEVAQVHPPRCCGQQEYLSGKQPNFCEYTRLFATGKPFLEQPLPTSSSEKDEAVSTSGIILESTGKYNWSFLKPQSFWINANEFQPTRRLLLYLQFSNQVFQGRTVRNTSTKTSAVPSHFFRLSFPMM